MLLLLGIGLFVSVFNWCAASSVTLSRNSSLLWRSTAEFNKLEFSDFCFQWRTLSKNHFLLTLEDKVELLKIICENQKFHLNFSSLSLNSSKNISDGNWHNVSVKLTPLQVILDGDELVSNKNVNVTFNYTGLRVSLGDDRFYGCFKDVQFGQRSLPFNKNDTYFVIENSRGVTSNCTEEVQCSPDSCQNNGTCVSTGWNQWKCECKSGYLGNRCELLNPCAGDKCKGRGTCTVVDMDFLCTCTDISWTGKTCDELVDWCENVTCLNEGECVNGTCNCTIGFEGGDCGDANCALVSCQNGGTCWNNETFWRCECPPGWTGQLCQDNIDQCLSAPCKNGGTCIDLPGVEFNCTCPQGYTGVFCENLVDHCQSSPCQHGGTCINIPQVGFNCSCPERYIGVYCETEIPIEKTPSNNALIVGLSVGLTLLFLLVICVFIGYRLLTQKRTFRGVYKPNKEENISDFHMSRMMKAPPEERLI